LPESRKAVIIFRLMLAVRDDLTLPTAKLSLSFSGSRVLAKTELWPIKAAPPFQYRRHSEVFVVWNSTLIYQ
ncbi:MAG: hypothetical protein K0U57_11235, partial [Alphaproteobacteria bacterium]|nr:hypothetical protein [Alphaproteobacteria bacterium]